MKTAIKTFKSFSRELSSLSANKTLIYFHFQEKSSVKPQDKQSSNVKKSKVAIEMTNVSMSAKNSPMKAFSKAPASEALKAEVKQAGIVKHEEKSQTNDAKNNNKATNRIEVANESDDDDSVFINENKPKKSSKALTKHKTGEKVNVSSVMLSGANVSSLKGKAAPFTVPQNHNSRDLNVESERVVR